MSLANVDPTDIVVRPNSFQTFMYLQSDVIHCLYPYFVANFYSDPQALAIIKLNSKRIRKFSVNNDIFRNSANF
jgi:hypothetical protein